MIAETMTTVSLIVFILLEGVLVFLGFKYINSKVDLLVGVLLKQNQHVDTLIKLMSLPEDERLPYLQKQIYPPEQYPEMYEDKQV